MSTGSNNSFIELSSRYILVLLCISVYHISLIGQGGWDGKDPVDVGFVDLADNKLIVYNLLGYGLSELIESQPKFDTTHNYQVSLGHYAEYDRSPLSDIYVASYRGGKYVRKYLSIGLSAHLYAVTTEGDFVVGTGGRLWFAWHIINRPNIQLTYDNGVGPNYFTSPFPFGGTRFNFTTHYGLKLSTKLGGRWWSLRLTNIHISNADIRGRERNPALDAFGISVATEW